MISPDDHKRLQPFLHPGERLLWAGRPKGGVVLRLPDLYLIPFGILWVSLALGSIALDPTRDPDLFSWVWSIVVISLGTYLLAGRFLHEAWVRAHLLYAVTSQRVVVVRTPPWQRFKSLELGYLPVLDYEEHRDGRGTLTFDFDGEDDHPWWMHHQNHGSASQLMRMRFDRIEQPRLVYDLVRREAERRRSERIGEVAGPRSFIG